jgi:outer membrane protein assembly factor BamD
MTKRLALVLLALGLVGCASSEPDLATLASNSDQLIWEAGQKAYSKKQWENARQHFRRIVDGFPQSEFGPAARLALADSYFSEGGTANYILAVSAYRDFLTLYPSHPKSDYAQFQVAEGFFKQRNGPDRDQTATMHALEEYQRLLELYPSSQHIETARGRIVTCRQTLARSEFLAGYFYQRTRNACRSAIFRYEGVLAEYPDYAQIDEVLFRLSECLVKAGRALEAPPHLARLLEDHPTSDYADEARAMQQLIPNLPPPAAPPDPPAPTAAQPSPSPSPAPRPTPARPRS